MLLRKFIVNPAITKPKIPCTEFVNMLKQAAIADANRNPKGLFKATYKLQQFSDGGLSLDIVAEELAFEDNQQALMCVLLAFPTTLGSAIKGYARANNHERVSHYLGITESGFIQYHFSSISHIPHLCAIQGYLLANNTEKIIELITTDYCSPVTVIHALAATGDKDRLEAFLAKQPDEMQAAYRKRAAELFALYGYDEQANAITPHAKAERIKNSQDISNLIKVTRQTSEDIEAFAQTLQEYAIKNSGLIVSDAVEELAFAGEDQAVTKILTQRPEFISSAIAGYAMAGNIVKLMRYLEPMEINTIAKNFMQFSEAFNINAIKGLIFGGFFEPADLLIFTDRMDRNRLLMAIPSYASLGNEHKVNALLQQLDPSSQDAGKRAAIEAYHHHQYDALADRVGNDLGCSKLPQGFLA